MAETQVRQRQTDEKTGFRRIDRAGQAPVYVTSLGAEIVRGSEVLKSLKGRKLIDDMANLEKLVRRR